MQYNMPRRQQFSKIWVTGRRSICVVTWNYLDLCAVCSRSTNTKAMTSLDMKGDSQEQEQEEGRRYALWASPHRACGWTQDTPDRDRQTDRWMDNMHAHTHRIAILFEMVHMTNKPNSYHSTSSTSYFHFSKNPQIFLSVHWIIIIILTITSPTLYVLDLLYVKSSLTSVVN